MTIVGTAVHTKIAESVVQRIQDLALSGVSDSNVQLRVFDEDLSQCMPGPPGVMVLTVGVEQVNQREGENNRVHIAYPVPVIIGDVCESSDGIETVTEIDRHLKWREDIRSGLWHKTTELRAAGAPDEVYEIIWVPGQIFLPKTWAARNMWVGTMLFRVKTCEIM